WRSRQFEWFFLPTCKCLLKICNQIVSLEIARYSEPSVVRDIVSIVPGNHVFAFDLFDLLPILIAAVWMLAIDQLCVFARSNSGRVIVSSDDPLLYLLLFEIEPIFRKRGIHNDVGIDFQSCSKIF